MSITRRLISGSVASWVQILITLVVQVVLVPVFLVAWGKEQYGIWLAIQSFISLISMIDKGHQYYIYFEALKMDESEKNKFNLFFGSSLRVGILSGLLQVLIIFGIIGFGFTKQLFGLTDTTTPEGLHFINMSLLLQGLVWVLFGISGGLMGRILAVKGYYPRVAWWNVLGTTVTAVTPAITVYLGGTLLEATMSLFVGSMIFNIPFHIDMYRIIRKKDISLGKFSSSIGFSNLFKSLAVSVKDVLENFRQQGIRVVLSSIVGGAGLAVFSTTRTGANVLLQGLNTITNPMIPELMQFLRNKDQPRIDAAFNTIWALLVFMMAPGIVILQLIMEPIFIAWTKGQIEFDPLLFLLFSFTILIYTLSQPAIALVTGNNLLKQQLQMSVLSSVVLIVLMFVLIPYLDIVGAGIALVIAELMSTYGYRLYAKRWINEKGLTWPVKNFQYALLSMWSAFIFGLLIIWLPQYKYLVLLGYLVLYAFISIKYWATLPQIARNKVQQLLGKFYRKK
ncbi:hypothetical protein GR160_12100 [Flavobacterium sp. Sd200]|uniref:lipopolysaccharide biosynthesis protein n=1 Tax=Flavobacterium sp. Sd200 TaxID=2692211 RepID=UPI00136B787E|nr:hypothetical protein [Flavobacterium sp. Sd200]MXN91967.1 hypothetical protein [Flavobacterium sp. Sd200]